MTVDRPLPAEPTKLPRFRCLDLLRGLAIAAMILVNNPGSWAQVYPPLLHAEWHGFTPTDLVFPLFLFVVGGAMAFSLGRVAEKAPLDRPQQRQIHRKLLQRVLILFGLGLALNASSLLMRTWFEGAPLLWEKWRILGVLQRIALAYGASALLVLHCSRRAQAIAVAGLWLGYWALLSTTPLTPDGSIVGWVDRTLLGESHLYQLTLNQQTVAFDPEGLLSTLPAIGSTLAGYWAVQWLKTQPIKALTAWRLTGAGVGAIALGRLWDLALPLNKQLWTSSYALYAAGWSIVLLAGCYALTEIRRAHGISRPFEIFGMNAITAFVGSGLVGRLLNRTHIGSGPDAPSTYQWLYQTLFASWAGPMSGSLLFAIAMVLLWWLAMYGFYRRGWFLKV